MEYRNSARENCALCGKINPKRAMNKLYYAPSNYSVVNPRIICHLCDSCFKMLLDDLEVDIKEERNG